MRKALAVGIITLSLLAGCDSGESNYNLFPIELQYDYADIRLFDGTVKTVRVAKWSDTSNNDRVTILDTDGVTWYLHASNVILRREAQVEDATR